MTDLQKKIDDLMKTPEAIDIKTLVAFSVRKTKTLTDDEILDNIDEIVQTVSENIKEVAEQRPTDKEAKDAAVRILKSVAAHTETKWDDRAVKILDIII